MRGCLKRGGEERDRQYRQRQYADHARERRRLGPHRSAMLEKRKPGHRGAAA